MTFTHILAAGALPVAAALAACAPGDAAEARRADTAGALTLAPALAAAPAAMDSASAARVARRFVVAPTGNEARYRVRERLVGKELDNDAVGRTDQVTGAVAVDSAGAIVAAASRFEVDASAMVSDHSRRDGYVRARLLQADQHPTVQLVPTGTRGLPATLPAAGAEVGPRTFELLGELTVRGVTRPTVWQVTARYDRGRIMGSARTAFTFADFDLTQPRVPVVLSVADTIRLEYDFTLVAAP